MSYNNDKLAALSSAFDGENDGSSGKIHVTHTVERTESPSHGYAASQEEEDVHQMSHDLNATEDDILEAKDYASQLSLEETKTILERVYKLHERDPNFPLSIVRKIELFLKNKDVFRSPEKHEVIIHEMKLEAALIVTNSPYAEVRAVVDCHDDPTMPVSTIRAWVIGLFFATALSFVNQLFSTRLPPIVIGANVPQLLCYPVGKLWEMVMPDVGFTLFGVRHSLNPGRFNKKEHMLITIMANVSWNQPYTNGIIWIQYLPHYYNQRWAGNVGYQLLVAMSTNFIGYGMAGICRRFLVYPAYCVWPASLVTIALNSAFHTERNVLVQGPFRRIYRASRLKLFVMAFTMMFIYFFFPSFIWTSLMNFSWISWIAPNNRDLVTVTGFNNGVGLNPWPTFDWNVLQSDGTDPLVIPFFSTLSKFVGSFLSAFAVLGMWYRNGYSTGYLPINAMGIYDNTGDFYNVSRAVDERKLFNPEGYENYSPPFLSAGGVVSYLMFFGIYSSAFTYAYLYHRYEIMLGIRTFIRSFRNKEEVTADRELDVHNRLMQKYKEVPEWWYTVVLVLAMILGIVGIAAFPTYTTPGVVFYGLLLCILFVVPVGIIKAMTGIEVPLNVLAEFIGGSIVEGNALAMNYFKTFGFIVCSQAILFSNDLKLAHYVKVPPRFTFWAQIIGTLVSTLVCTGVLNFQMHLIPDICTDNAKWRMTCPGVNTFYMASVLWGTVGPKKVWGSGGMYTLTLIGFPIGFFLTLGFFFLQKKFPHWGALRQLHPVAIMYGGTAWCPYNVSWIWPMVPVAWLGWLYVKRRFIGFWSKYNFVLSAAFGTGIAISGIVIFFGLQWQGLEPPMWWGNEVNMQGCEAEACLLHTLDRENGEYFGPRIGTFH